MAEPELFLCADGGGTSVRVVLANRERGVVAKGSDGCCNVKTVGTLGAMKALLDAIEEALETTGVTGEVEWQAEAAPRLKRRLFKKVWLGLAGVNSQEDIAQVDEAAHAAFRIPPEEKDALRITNDGHLLASPCSLLPNIDNAVVLVAGTGTVGFSFRKQGHRLECSGISRGWGYLLGDDGSAYNIGRLAIRAMLEDNDRRLSFGILKGLKRSCCSTTSACQCASTSTSPPPPRLAIYNALLKYFGVPSCAALIDKSYSDHSSPSAPSFPAAEAARKVWFAEAARIVFAYAFGPEGEADEQSKEVASRVVQEAVVELVDIAARLAMSPDTNIDLSRAALSLGGGLWKVEGYRDLLLQGLERKGIRFAEVVTVVDPAEEGVKALLGYT